MSWISVMLAVAVLGGIGAIFGVILTAANKKLSVKEDERLPGIRALLGGANCGACGFAGCDAFAGALIAGETGPERCTVISAENRAGIGEILGVEVAVTEPVTACVLCAGKTGIAVKAYEYEGPNSCRIAAGMAGGPKQCGFSCIGLGDCVSACAFGAISIRDALCVIDADACMGCGACAEICPRGVIALLPKSRIATVVCCNEMSARAAKSVCASACIACGRCKKNCPEDAITVENGCARIDPYKCSGCGKCVPLCPGSCIELTGEGYMCVKNSVSGDLHT